MMSQDITRL